MIVRQTTTGRVSWYNIPWFVSQGPPTIAFTWRHWADYEGKFHGFEPTKERIEVIGSAVATVNADMKISTFDIYYDPSPMLGKLYHGKCKFSQK